MELIKKNIYMEHQRTLATTQISLEEDQNISDQKPDAFQIVCKKSHVKIEEVKAQEESVYIKGKLLYQALYLTDEKEKRLCSLEGDMEFEEKVYVSMPIGNTQLHVLAEVEDMTIRLINSRKINIRCILALSIRQDELCNEEVIVDAKEPDCCEILKKPMDVTTIAVDTKDIYRIKEEIPLPEGFPNIYKLIWKNIRVDGLNYIPMDGRIGIQGEWNAFFMFEGEEEETIPRYFEVTRPFSGILELPDCKENMLLCVEHEIELPQIEIRSDYDGEERVIGMEVEIKLYIKLYQNQVMPIVTDAYGLYEDLEPICKESVCEHLLKRESGKIKLDEYWENKEDPEEELQILHTNGELVDEKVTADKEELILQGVVHMELLCRCNRENRPYRCIVIDIPYTQKVTANGVMPDSPNRGWVGIEQLSSTLQGKRIEVRAVLSYQVDIYKKENEPLLIGMGKNTEKNTETTLPVMSVYFAKEGENIWNIGKKYRVSLNEIREINQLNADILQEGQKILIAKEMN